MALASFVVVLAGLSAGVAGCAALEKKTDDWRVKNDAALARVEDTATATARVTSTAGAWLTGIFAPAGAVLLTIGGVATAVAGGARMLRKRPPGTPPPPTPETTHDTPGGGQLPAPAAEPTGAMKIGPATLTANRRAAG